MDIFNQMESEVRGYCRSFPTVFTTARGATLFNEEGKPYLDFLSGAGTLNYGHNNLHIKQAVIEYLQGDGLVHGLDMFSGARREFLKTLDELILQPRSLDYKVQFPGPTGTNAVETALKLARLYTGRQTIASFTNGFHGCTLGSLACTANSHFRSGAGVGLDDTVFIPYCDYLGEGSSTIDYFRKLLEDPSSGLDTPAAVIVEAVQGEGGVNVASIRWLRELEMLCKEHEMIFILDDIQAGNGRTGTFFSFDRAEIEPDIVLLSKSLSGLGLPLSIVLMRPELDIWKPSQHNGTFRGNNLSLVAATAALKQYWSDGKFAKEIQSKAAEMTRRLTEIVDADPKGRLSTRGRGLMQGLVCDPPELAGKITAAAYERGLIIETSGGHGQVVKCLPPLTLTLEEMHQGLDILSESVAAVFKAVAKDSRKTTKD